MTIPVATSLNLDNIIIPDICNQIRPVEQPATSGAKTRAAKDVNRQGLKLALDKSAETNVRYCTTILQSSQNYSYTASLLIKRQPRGHIVEIDEDKKIYEMKVIRGIITTPFKVNSLVGEMSYTYEVEESTQSWITSISLPIPRAPCDVPESFITKANTEIENQPREGKITFKSTNSTDKVSNQLVIASKQAGFIVTPPSNAINATVTPGAGSIQLQWEISEDVDFNKIRITYYGKIMKEDKEILINDYKTTPCIINDTYQCTGEYLPTISTYGSTGMETGSPVIITGISDETPEVGRVALTTDMPPDNANHVEDGGGLPALIDGKASTHYHTKWNASVITEVHYVQIKLNKSLKDLCFEYDARQSGVNNGGDVRAAAVYGNMNGESFESMDNEEFNLSTANGGHATTKNNVGEKQAYNYIQFTPMAHRGKDPSDYIVAGNIWWNMPEIYPYRIRHDEVWAREQLGI